MSRRRVHPVRSTLAVALVGAVVASFGPATAGAQQDPQARLQVARDRLAEIATRIDRADVAADEADGALDAADEQLRAVEAIVNDVATQVEDQRIARGDAQRRLTVVEAEADELAAAFADRVTRLYKQGPDLAFEVLLASRGTEQALARTTMLQRLTEGDQIDLERLAAAEVAVEAERRRYAAEHARLERLLAEQQEILAEATRLRETRALAAAEARARVRGLRDEQDDLEAEQADLERVIRQAQRDARRRDAERAARQRQSGQASSGSASSNGGRTSTSGYAWPMCAPVTSEYGQRWGRLHRGIDQGASTGSAIGASKSGTVLFAGWQGGYGRLILIDHHDGVVTAYAHMSRFAVGKGAAVAKGQTIGYVGSTGNSTGPHLHFETRVNGTAANPRQYLPGGPC